MNFPLGKNFTFQTRFHRFLVFHVHPKAKGRCVTRGKEKDVVNSLRAAKESTPQRVALDRHLSPVA